MSKKRKRSVYHDWEKCSLCARFYYRRCECRSIESVIDLLGPRFDRINWLEPERFLTLVMLKRLADDLSERMVEIEEIYESQRLLRKQTESAARSDPPPDVAAKIEHETAS